MVGNLGDYQRITQWSKSVGGPKQFLALVWAAGAMVGGAVSAAAKPIYKRAAGAYRRRVSGAAGTPPESFTVEGTVHLQKSSPLCEGETFRVIAQDGDTLVLEVEGRQDNPHVLSLEKLSAASDIPADFKLE